MRRPSLARAGAAFATTGTTLAVTAGPAHADVPGAGIVRDAVGATAGWAWDKVAAGIAGWVLGGVAQLVDGVLNFLKTAARPDVEAVWFAGAGSPYATVRSIAGVLLLAFVFLGLLQGLLQGDVGGMVRRVAGDLPLAVLGMVATIAVVARLLELTDALSTAVLEQGGGQATAFLAGFGTAAASATSGFAAVLVGLVAVVAALLVWIELMIRSALVYVLVALSPLAFAAAVWPATRGVLRRTAEVLLAVVLSKFVICVAIAIGVAALGGAGQAAGPTAGVGEAAATGMGALSVGASVLAMAAFSPFLLLKLIPVAEAALLTQGVSRAPLRTAQAGVGVYYQASSINRLAGNGRGFGGVAATPGSVTSVAHDGAGGGAAGPAPAPSVAAAGPVGAATVATSATAGAVRTAGERDADVVSAPTATHPEPGSTGRAGRTAPPDREPPVGDGPTRRT